MNGRSGFICIALCVLQMIGNSASTECAFSVFGLTKDVHESGLTRICPTGTGGPKGLTCDRAWIRGKRVRYDRDP